MKRFLCLMLFCATTAMAQLQIKATAPISVGGTHQFAATCTFNSGTGPCPTLKWNSTNPSVTISTTGLATGVSPGSSVITASSGTIISNAITLTINPVAPPTLTGVTLSAPPSSTIAVGGTANLTVTCKYSDGSSDTCNTADKYGNAVSWFMMQAGTQSVASLSATGLVTGIASGRAVFAAYVGSFSAVSVVLVQ